LPPVKGASMAYNDDYYSKRYDGTN
jgi:hypothetical protein